MEYEKKKVYEEKEEQEESRGFLLKSLDKQIFEMPAVCH